MKFEIKTEPVCAVLVSVPAYIAIVVITLYTGMKAEDAWLPLTVTFLRNPISVSRNLWLLTIMVTECYATP
jgi:hypothetical protein